MQHHGEILVVVAVCCRPVLVASNKESPSTVKKGQ